MGPYLGSYAAYCDLRWRFAGTTLLRGVEQLSTKLYGRSVEVMALTEQELLDLLEQHQINYIVRQHEPIYTVAEGVALGLEGSEAAVKSLLLTDDKRTSFYLLVLPLDKQLDLKQLRVQLGSRRLTMASPAELHQLLGLEPGSVTPLGLLADSEHKVQTYFDATLRESTIAIPLLSNTTTLWLPCCKLVQLLEDKGHGISYLEL